MSKTVFQILTIAALSLSFFCMSGALPAYSQEGPNASGRLVPVMMEEGASLEPNKRLAVLDLNLSPGWHTYWKHSGDSGLPPRFDWSGSENVESVEVAYPAPMRFQEFDLQVFGYHTAVSFPLEVTLKEAAKPATLDLKLDVLVCHEICVPERLELKTALTGEDGKTQSLNYSQKMYDFKMNRVPSESELAGLKIDTATLGPQALVLNVTSKSGFDRLGIIPVAEDVVISAMPEITLDKTDNRQAMIKILKPDDVEDLASWMSGKTLVVTVVSGRDAIVKEFAF